MHAAPRRRKGDEQLRVSFFSEAIQDEVATAEAGRPVYKDVDWVRIRVPADPSADMQSYEDTFIVNQQYIDRFPDEFAEYKRLKAEPMSGTPLKMWPAITGATVAELQAIGLKTVEQLAEVDGKELRLNEWLKPHVEKARAWVRVVQEGQDVLALTAAVERLEREKAELEEQNKELLATIQEFKAADKRKKKAEAADA